MSDNCVMPDDGDDARTRSETIGQSFVLRCRVERFAEGEARPHFVLEEVGRDTVWRYTDIESVLEALRTRIARLMSGSAPPLSET